MVSSGKATAAGALLSIFTVAAVAFPATEALQLNVHQLLPPVGVRSRPVFVGSLALNRPRRLSHLAAEAAEWTELGGGDEDTILFSCITEDGLRDLPRPSGAGSPPRCCVLACSSTRRGDVAPVDDWRPDGIWEEAALVSARVDGPPSLRCPGERCPHLGRRARLR